MFPDFKTAEIEYYRRTGIHPIMHCVVLRGDRHQEAPWVLRSIYESLLRARQKTMAALSNTQALAAMIPMLPGSFNFSRVDHVSIFRRARRCLR